MRVCERISLLGSLVTAKAIPKDVDLLVTIDSMMDLTQLAQAGRRLMGSIQSINLGRLGVDPSTVQRISRPFDGASVAA
jgi:hypothetical protein